MSREGGGGVVKKKKKKTEEKTEKEKNKAPRNNRSRRIWDQKSQDFKHWMSTQGIRGHLRGKRDASPKQLRESQFWGLSRGVSFSIFFSFPRKNKAVHERTPTSGLANSQNNIHIIWIFLSTNPTHPTPQKQTTQPSQGFVSTVLKCGDTPTLQINVQKCRLDSCIIMTLPPTSWLTEQARQTDDPFLFFFPHFFSSLLSTLQNRQQQNCPMLPEHVRPVFIIQKKNKKFSLRSTPFRLKDVHIFSHSSERFLSSGWKRVFWQTSPRGFQNAQMPRPRRLQSQYITRTSWISSFLLSVSSLCFLRHNHQLHFGFITKKPHSSPNANTMSTHMVDVWYSLYNIERERDILYHKSSLMKVTVNLGLVGSFFHFPLSIHSPVSERASEWPRPALP